MTTLSALDESFVLSLPPTIRELPPLPAIEAVVPALDSAGPRETLQRLTAMLPETCAPAVLFLTAPPGTGKTTLSYEVERACAGIAGIEVWHYDDKQMSRDAMLELGRTLLPAGGEEWEYLRAGHKTACLRATAAFLGERPDARLVLFEGIFEVQDIAEICLAAGIETFSTILLDVPEAQRDAQLRERGSPEMVCAAFHEWASLLRGHARELGVEILENRRGEASDPIETHSKIVAELTRVAERAVLRSIGIREERVLPA